MTLSIASPKKLSPAAPKGQNGWGDEATPPIIGRTCAFDVKISIQKSVKNLVSRYGKRSKNFCVFFDFCAQLPAVLIETLLTRRHQDAKGI
jgi:hypothetical protein